MSGGIDAGAEDDVNDVLVPRLKDKVVKKRKPDEEYLTKVFFISRLKWIDFELANSLLGSLHLEVREIYLVR